MARRMKKDPASRQIVVCLWLWLMKKTFPHMLEWSDKKSQEFTVLFMNKRNRQWMPCYLDLFKALDNISPKKAMKYKESPGYDKECKKRCHSNLQKLCIDGILKHLKIETVKESIVKYHYRFLIAPDECVFKHSPMQTIDIPNATQVSSSLNTASSDLSDSSGDISVDNGLQLMDSDLSFISIENCNEQNNLKGISFMQSKDDYFNSTKSSFLSDDEKSLNSSSFFSLDVNEIGSTAQLTFFLDNLEVVPSGISVATQANLEILNKVAENSLDITSLLNNEKTLNNISSGIKESILPVWNNIGTSDTTEVTTINDSLKENNFLLKEDIIINAFPELDLDI